MGVYRRKGEREKGTDRVGFEPTNGLPRYTLSRRVPSATRPPVPRQLRSGMVTSYERGATLAFCTGVG